MSAQISQTYDVNGVRYATLDNASSADPTVGNQDALLALPEGWTLATSNSNTQLAATSAPWGTDCLVLADGNMISTTPGGSCTDTQFIVDATGQIRPKLKRIFISQTMGTIGTISPSSGPLIGGFPVTIVGSNLGNGNDITEVTLAGIRAEIVSQSATQVVVTAGRADAAVRDNVVVRSTTRGASTASNSFSYIQSGAITSVTPRTGPFTGGNQVTIAGTTLGNGNDITSVQLAGVTAAIVSQTANAVVVTAARAQQSGAGSVTVTSTSYGVSSLSDAYTYNSVPTIASVQPASGPAAGGNSVTIFGQLGEGTDITSVTLNGVPATIVSQTASQVVVTAGAGSGSGDVVVRSTSYGVATLVNEYTYMTAIQIRSVSPNRISAAGGSVVVITSDDFFAATPDISRVTLAGVQATIQSLNRTAVVVVANPGTAGTGDVVIVSATHGTFTLTGGITLTQPGMVTTVVPATAPVAGNAVVTITGSNLGSGSDITSVTLANIEADILSQTSSQVVVRTRSANELSGNIVIRSLSMGIITLQNSFAYVPPGTITSVTPAAAPADGVTPVTITGNGLGSGSDISAVTLAGVPATIRSQTATQVVILPGPSGPTTGTVTVRSDSRGTASSPNAFTYQFFAGVTYAQPPSGPAVGGTTVTVTSQNPLGSGTDITAVTLAGVAAVLQSQNATAVVVQTRAGTPGTGPVVVQSTSRGATTINNGFTYNPAGTINNVDPAVGPVLGQARVTISGSSLGSGSDITAVLVKGVAATIVSQTPNSVIVTTGAATQGQGDVEVRSLSFGVARRVNAYLYNDTSAPLPSFTFNNIQYAVLDSAAPEDQGQTGCQDRFASLPTGWQIAADNTDTRVALMGPRFKFGTRCLVLASGAGIDSATTASCGSNMLVQIGATYAVASCPGRILLSKAAPPGTVNTWTSKVFVTNYTASQGVGYATIENIQPDDQTLGCSNVAMQLPDGWTLAERSQRTVQVVQQFNFGSACIVLRDGSSINHAGNPCPGAEAGQLLNVSNYLAVPSCQQRILIQAPLPVPLPPVQSRSLNLRLLIVSPTGDASDSQLGVAQQVCMGIGSHCDTWAATPTATTPSSVLTGNLNQLLASSDTKGNYFGIVVTQGALLANNATVNTALLIYCRKFRVDIVSLYSFPTPALGVAVNTQAPGGAANTNTRFNAAIRSERWIGGIVPTHTVPLTNVFHYPVLITDPSIARPVLEFVNDAGQVEGVAAAIVDPGDGHREMHFFLSQVTWSFPCSVYSPVWFQWLTRGMYVGARRIVLGPQIDDWFLSTAVWNNATNSSTGTPYRTTTANTQYHIDFINRVNAELPAGSNIKFEIAFNGLGAGNRGTDFPGDELLQGSIRLMSNFWWESHTFSHLNLTQPTDLTPPRNTTYEEVFSELSRNSQFALAQMFTTPDRLQYYDSVSIVTPGISGLHNPAALRAMKENGILYVVGDNSIPALRPFNPYYCRYTTAADNGLDGILIVPRFPTSMYFDCSLPAENVNEYNFVYRAFWGRALTLDEIMQLDATRATGNLMQYRPDFYQFHQANTRTFMWQDPITRQPATFSLLTLWLRYLQRSLSQYSTLPVLTYRQRDAAQRCLAREARDNCPVTFTANLDASNNVSSITASGGPCNVPITGPQFQAQANTQSETYGPDLTTWVNLTAPSSNVTLSLTTPLRWV